MGHNPLPPSSHSHNLSSVPSPLFRVSTPVPVIDIPSGRPNLGRLIELGSDNGYINTEIGQLLIQAANYIAELEQREDEAYDMGYEDGKGDSEPEVVPVKCSNSAPHGVHDRVGDGVVYRCKGIKSDFVGCSCSARQNSENHSVHSPTCAYFID